MEYIKRTLEEHIRKTLNRNKSVLLLGPRQTGKTTLISRIKGDLTISLIQPDVRLRYEKNPSLLRSEVEALNKPRNKTKLLVMLDEIQKVPQLVDVVQDLIDRRVANFILTGSSARKLRRGANVNLLPGRVVSLKLDPLTLSENFPSSLKSLLLYGSLPGIVQTSKDNDKETDLESYVTTYLEEEVRAEAIVRNLGSFARFLEYAASEAGQIINFRKLSQEIGVSHTTISSYYQILDDCLIIKRIEPISKSSTRKKLTKTPKYLFFDLGVRRLAAKEGIQLPRESWGKLFEQFVGLELLRQSRLLNPSIKIKFWRDPNGPESDWVIEKNKSFIPIEVKWSDRPSFNDAKSLKIFLSEYKEAKKGYIICQTPRKLKLSKDILAIPWQEIDKLFTEI